ncbi:MAG TPA: hypothetical protein VMY37_10190 [Thermoguttaceae bacterium]|nr:hypothetical protein [Thermoguttaceae bacterium]
MAWTPSTVLDATTLNDRFKVKTDPLKERSVMMAGMESNGRIEYNAEGENVEWRPEIRTREITAANPYRVRMSFPSRNVWMKATLGWSTYNLGERIAKVDRLANKGDAAFFNLVDKVVDGMSRDFVKELPKKFYIDGSSYPEDLQGLESIYSVDGLVSSGYVGDPDGTYAGNSQALGALGGSWDSTGVWPHLGVGTNDYSAWSPMVVDYQAALWTSYAAHTITSAVWAQTWRVAMNFLYLNMGRIRDMAPDVCILHTELLRQAEDTLQSTERFEVTANSDLTKLGHKTVQWKGIELAHEFACPSAVGYMFSWDNLTLKSMQSQLVGYENDHKIESSDDIYAADFYGQLIIEIPGYMGKLAAVTAGS